MVSHLLTHFRLAVKRALRSRTSLVVGLALASGATAMLPDGATASAAPPITRVKVHTLVSGLPDVPPPSFFAGVGPFGLAFGGAHRLLVSDAANLGFYSFERHGSTTAPTPLTTGNVQTGLTLGKGGELFAALYQAGNINQVDPTTGQFIRQLNPVGTTYNCVTGLVTDPISGDLFFGQPNSGGVCPGNSQLTRVEDPTSVHPTFVAYTAQPGVNYTGVAFAPDGTLYAVQQSSDNGCAVRISGTNSPSPPTITTIACFPAFQNEFIGIDAIAVSPDPYGAPTLYVAGPSGTITKIDQSTNPPTLTPVVTLPTRIDGLLVGQGGRLYATQSTSIVRISGLARG